MSLNYVLHLKEWRAHLEAESFSFVRAGDNTSIIIREDYDRASHEPGLEDTLARDVKVIRVY
jgi:hypothetical protein